MDEIRWFESHPEGELLAALRKFDHHQIEIDGVTAVLMTHVNLDTLERGLLAVVHPAANRHPQLPHRVREAAARLVWEQTGSPLR